MKRIYIAGAIRADDPWQVELNIRRAEEIGLRVCKLDCSPFIPHSMTRYIAGAMPDSFWIAADLAFLETCAAVMIVNPGWEESIGTNIEMKYADKKGIPFFHWDLDEPTHPQFEEWLITTDKDSKPEPYVLPDLQEATDLGLPPEYLGQWTHKTS